MKFNRLNRLSQSLKKKITIMLVPHSSGKTITLRFSPILVLVLLLFVVFSISYGLFTIIQHSQYTRELAQKEVEVQTTSDGLNLVLSEVEVLMRMFEIFESSLQVAKNEFNISSQSSPENTGTGDLSAISGIQQINPQEVSELFELRQLRESLTNSIEPINQIGRSLQREQSLLSDLPILWPVLGGRNALTMEYGPNLHPVWENWYLHTGISIQAPLGTPILASANGRVVQVSLDLINGLGNTVLIEHNYGLRTRYSHLARVLVQEGQEVYQGQQIATLGRTGITNIPNLHFQIILGTEILNPVEFLKIRNDFSQIQNTRLN
jgi:murein DD-endopeptidase MepM/ murein hydrolase activator NlpD